MIDLRIRIKPVDIVFLPPQGCWHLKEEERSISQRWTLDLVKISSGEPGSRQSWQALSLDELLDAIPGIIRKLPK